MGRRVDFGDFLPETGTVVPAELQAPLRETIRREAARIVAAAERDVDGKPERDPEEEAAEAGLDISRECPVCRSLDPCECEEPDRAFVRRVRFYHGFSGVPRCPTCRGPMSTFYVPRRETKHGELAELKNHGGITACVACNGREIGSVIAAIADRYRKD